MLAGRDIAAIGTVASEMLAAGCEVEVVACDLTDTAACQALADAAIQRFGRIDILVNVAGGSGPMGKTGWETTRAEFDEIVTLNMAGCFNTMRAVLPGMTARAAARSSMSAARSACAGGPGGWPIPPPNGGCAASPNPWRWRPGRSA